VAVNPSTNRIYVANYNSNNVSVIDGAGNTVVATVAVVAGGNGPEGVAVNPNTNRIYVANFNSGNVSVIDGTSNTVVATVAVGYWWGGDGGVAVNPNTNLIYVTNYGGQGSDNVSVIDGASNTVVATVAVGTYPVGVAVNPNTNRIYVANLSDDTVSVIEDIVSPTPTATAQPTVEPTATAYIWPFQYIISGPATAHPGDLVSYHIDYQRNSSEAKDQASFVLSWTLNAASSFSLKTVTGPEATVEFQADGQAFVGIATQQGGGSAEITLRVGPSFTGTFTMGIYVRGTGITMPPGSVLVANTLVTPAVQQLSPPTTGTGPASGMPRNAILGLALAGVAALGAGVIALGVGGWYARRRCLR
ncbi:MAG: YncE family protein, partial [Dehalococcoidia bacterium]